jgi:hypothetical protein
MYRKLTSLIAAGICATLALSGTNATAEEKAAEKKADAAVSATGTWTWTQGGRNGGEGRKLTLTLTQDGEKLTGKLSSPGRDGGEARESEISEGSVKGADVAFSITREFNGNKVTAKYAGKLTADSITGKVTSAGRDGNEVARDWTAKKEAKDSKEAK